MAEKIKVLEVNVDDQGNGGVFSLIKSVIENKPDDLQIDIAALEPFEKKENIKHLKKYGTRIFFVGYKGNKLKKQAVIFKKMCNLLKKERYDVVHIHTDVANKMLVSGMAAGISGVKKIILHSHSTGVDSKNSKLKEKIHNTCRRALPFLKPIYAACSYSAAKWMFPKIKKEKIHIIKNGIDLEHFRFNKDIRNKIREELDVSSDTFLIGHVGRFMYTKNHEFIIKIFDEYRKKSKEEGRKEDAKLLLVGSGELEKEIKEKVADLNIEKKVIFYGISNNVNELLMGMDSFILPSHFEGFPVSGIEAQASGLPIIFSKNISREVGITNNTFFLPIGEGSVFEWVNCLLNIEKTKRKDNCDYMLKKGYDIKSMVRAFTDMYRA